ARRAPGGGSSAGGWGVAGLCPGRGVPAPRGWGSLPPPVSGATTGEPMRIEPARGVSPRGAWSYSAWRPPHLGGLVDHVWAYDGPSTHRRKRVFPNGRVELLLNFGEPYRV